MKTAGIRKECLIGKDSIIGEKTAQISTGSWPYVLSVIYQFFLISSKSMFLPTFFQTTMQMITAKIV